MAVDLSPNCLLQWKMNDDAANADIIDTSGNGRDGEYWKGFAPENTENHSVAGKVNTALNFPDVDTEMAIAQDIIPGGYPKVIAAWIKTSASGAEQPIGTLGDVPSVNYLGTSVEANGKISIWAENAGGRASSESAGTYNDGAWHLVIAVFQGASNRKLYVDNVLVATNTTIKGMTWASMYIANHYADSFDGDMDIICIFNKVLSADERAFLWNGGDGTESLIESAYEYSDYKAVERGIMRGVLRGVLQ